MITKYNQYLNESHEDVHNDYVMVDDEETDSIYIGKVKLTSRINYVYLSYFYQFNKTELKLEKISGSISLNKNTLNVIYQSDSLKNCLIKISNLYDDVQNFKIYKKYIIGETEKYIGIFEVTDTEPWIKYIHRFPNVKLSFKYYHTSNKIFKYSDDTFKNAPKSIISFNVDMNTIKEFDSLDDAYITLEIERDVNKFNI